MATSYAAIKLRLPVILAAFFLAACDMVNAPLKDFIAEQTGRAAGENWAFVTPLPADTETSSTGWVRFPEPAGGDAVIRVRLDNPRAYDLSVTAENHGSGAGAVTVSVLSPAEAEITVANPGPGETYRIVLGITGGPGGLREFPPFALPPLVCNTPLELSAAPAVTGDDVDWPMQSQAQHPGISSVSVAFQQRGLSPADLTERYDWDGVALVIVPGQQGQPGGPGKVRFPAAMNIGDHHVKVTVEDEWGFRAALPSAEYFTPVAAAAELARIGVSPEYPLDGNYELYADLSLTDWTPIGPDLSHAYGGIFDGREHTLSLHGFDPAAAGNTAVGIFGYTDGARIEDLAIIAESVNLQLAGTSQYFGLAAGYAKNGEFKNIVITSSKTIKIGGTINAYFYGGGIAGYIDSSQVISGCKNQADMDFVTVETGIFGGITGRVAVGGVVEDSHSTGTIRGSSTSTSATVHTGGIVGANHDIIQRCSTTGAVYSESYIATAGGIVGFNPGSTHSCYSSADIYVMALKDAFAGGLVGNTDPGSIQNSYSTGSVRSESTNTSGSNWIRSGGITGALGPSTNIENCYALGTVYSVNTDPVSIDIAYAGGIVSRSTGTCKNSAALNPSVSAYSSGTMVAHRISGWQDGGATLSNNIAWDGMVLTGGSVTAPISNGLDGESKTKAELLTHSTWENLFTGFASNWKWLPGYPYPVLSWQTAAPAYTPLP